MSQNNLREAIRKGDEWVGQCLIGFSRMGHLSVIAIIYFLEPFPERPNSTHALTPEVRCKFCLEKSAHRRVGPHAQQRRLCADDLFGASIRTRSGLDLYPGVSVEEIFGCEGDLVVGLKAWEAHLGYPLAKAPELARQLRKWVEDGRDPVFARRNFKLSENTTVQIPYHKKSQRRWRH